MAQYKKYSSIGKSTTESTETYEEIVPEITSLTEKQALIKNNKVCIVKCYADWCTPCQILKPLYAKLYTKYNLEGVCAIVKENSDLRISTDLQVVPTFQIYFYQQPESLITGADITEVETKIQDLLESIQ